jgi:4-aminobutyrate aminotransferase-like enzyme
MSLTSSKEKYSKPYEPLVPGFEIKPRDLELLKKENLADVAGIVTELVLGEGGYVAMSKEFVQGLRKICDENGIVLIFDEIQTGFGRTGKMFGFEHYGVIPDILCLSKAIASGLPLGAAVIKKELSQKWETSTHGGTFTGNPVATAAASATLKVLAHSLEKIDPKIEALKTGLEALKQKFPKLISEFRQLGFMMALVMQTPEISKKFRELCLENNLLMIACGKDYETVRVLPAVTVSVAEIKLGLKIMQKSLEAL